MEHDDSMLDQHSPDSSASHNGGSNAPRADNYRVIRKRNRVPLSCGACRHRKLKCNRQAPCDNCIKRGDGPSCTYAAPAAKRKGTNSSTPSSNAAPDDMQNRIDRLEGLVLSLMTNGNSSGSAAAAQAAIRTATSSTTGSGSLGPNLDSQLDDSEMNESAYVDAGENESETDGVTKSLGILKVDQEKNKTYYIGEAHWAALLTEISEVKNYFSSHKKQFEAQMEKIEERRKNAGVDVGSGPTLLFGAAVPPPRSEILRALPSRYMSDILIAKYFNTYDPATHILHGPTFHKQYQAHWQNPEKTSIVWIGLLFVIMRLALQSFVYDGDEPPEIQGKCHDLSGAFRAQMAHCLIIADYTKPQAFIIETLIHHLHAEHISNRDAEASIWILMGMIVRLAMRMGYHRDSKFFPDLTPFQGEMRRRVWSFIRTGDLLFSFQVALPPMVRLGDSDTDLPRNIYDHEFDETSAQLPPPRPQSEATPISYLIAKAKLSLGFGRVLEEINGVQRKNYEEILKIDKALKDIYESIPDHLQVRSTFDQQTIPAALVKARLNLATVYHKAVCVLHRRYVRLARSGNRYMYSRKTCLESAVQLLDFQAIIVQQEQMGNSNHRLEDVRNRVSSINTHDYLLAATLLCMDLYQSKEKANNDSASNVSTPNTNSSADTPTSNTSGSRGSVSSADSMVYVPGLPYTREDIIVILERSRDIWMAQRDISMEAFKASELLNLLLFHLKSSPSVPISAYPLTDPARIEPRGDSNDEQTAAMTLGMLQAGGGGLNTNTNLQAMQAAQMAQQAQMQFPGTNMNGTNSQMGWDKNTMDSLLTGNSLADPNLFSARSFGNAAEDWGNLFGAGNGMFPQTIFGNTASTGSSGINIDWVSPPLRAVFRVLTKLAGSMGSIHAT